jgi:hypothetical protein
MLYRVLGSTMPFGLEDQDEAFPFSKLRHAICHSQVQFVGDRWDKVTDAAKMLILNLMNRDPDQ